MYITNYVVVFKNIKLTKTITVTEKTKFQAFSKLN